MSLHRTAVPLAVLGLVGLGLVGLSLALSGPVKTAPTTPTMTQRMDLIPAQGISYALIAPAGESASGLIARSLQPSGDECPELHTQTLSGEDVVLPMVERPRPRNTGSAFASGLLCEIPVPSGLQGQGEVVNASGASSPVPTSYPTKIGKVVSIADTGCRIVNAVQDCESRRTWPLTRFGNQIAKAQPDLIIHAGDYHYDERPCPPKDEQKCGNAPSPDMAEPFSGTTQDWTYQFLAPFAPALAVAPLLAVRGNEEACFHSGNGYFWLLDPRKGSQNSCSPVKGKPPVYVEPSWSADFRLANGRSWRTVVVSSAYGWDNAISSYSEQARKSQRAGHRLATNGPADQTWLLVHRPLFGITTNKLRITGDAQWTPWISADQTLGARGLLGPYSMILSGHIHTLQAVQLPGQPGQLVIGGGGTYLDPLRGWRKPRHGPLANARGKPMAAGIKPYPNIKRWWNKTLFGYAIASPTDGKHWTVSLRGLDGSAVQRCSLNGRQIRC